MSDYSYLCGIYLAKNHSNLHAVDQNGKVILHKSVTHSTLITTIANIHSLGAKVGANYKTVITLFWWLIEQRVLQFAPINTPS